LADLNQLHGTLDELKSQEDDIVHSLANQLTYVKGLGRNAQLNSEAVSNMPTIVKKELVQSHDLYVQLTGDDMWLNLTLFNQSVLFTVIRELEYAFLQLTRHVDQLLTAEQLTFSGKLPLSLISPMYHTTYFGISPCLPENYKLIAGTKFDSIHEYYELK
jgi:hypothetical protein